MQNIIPLKNNNIIKLNQCKQSSTMIYSFVSLSGIPNEKQSLVSYESINANSQKIILKPEQMIDSSTPHRFSSRNYLQQITNENNLSFVKKRMIIKDKSFSKKQNIINKQQQKQKVDELSSAKMQLKQKIKSLQAKQNCTINNNQQNSKLYYGNSTSQKQIIKIQNLPNDNHSLSNLPSNSNDQHLINSHNNNIKIYNKLPSFNSNQQVEANINKQKQQLTKISNLQIQNQQLRQHLQLAKNNHKLILSYQNKINQLTIELNSFSKCSEQHQINNNNLINILQNCKQQVKNKANSLQTKSQQLKDKQEQCDRLKKLLQISKEQQQQYASQLLNKCQEITTNESILQPKIVNTKTQMQQLKQHKQHKQHKQQQCSQVLQPCRKCKELMKEVVKLNHKIFYKNF